MGSQFKTTFSIRQSTIVFSALFHILKARDGLPVEKWNRLISKSFNNYVQEADLHSSVRIRELGITWQVLDYRWVISNSLNSVGKKEVTEV